jgi:protein disulfide-isomerase-like protein
MAPQRGGGGGCCSVRSRLLLPVAVVVLLVLTAGASFLRAQPTANLVYNEFVTHLDFETYVAATTDTLWAVEFYAPWCPHCQRFAPTWTEVAAEMHERDPRLRVGVVNCVAQRDLCTLFGVSGYPTLKTVHEGQPVSGPFEGPNRTKASVVAWLTEEMAKYSGSAVVPSAGGSAAASVAAAARVDVAAPPGVDSVSSDGSAVLSKTIVEQVHITLGDLASTLVSE